MTDEIIRKSALFFFLLTLDDQLARTATAKALTALKLRLKQRSGASAHEDSDLETALQCCLEQWNSIKPLVSSEKTKLINTKSLLWPEHIDLNPWKDFKKKCSEPELIAVIGIHVLGLSEATLSRCLKVSEGTIRYRVGHGLSLLGQLNRPTVSSIQFS